MSRGNQQFGGFAPLAWHPKRWDTYISSLKITPRQESHQPEGGDSRQPNGIAPKKPSWKPTCAGCLLPSKDLVFFLFYFFFPGPAGFGGVLSSKEVITAG